MFIWTIWFSSGCLHFQGATWDLTPPNIFGGFPWCSWQGRSGRPHYKGACRRRTRRSNYTWTVVTVVKGATLILTLLHWLWVTGFDGDILTESLVGPILTPPHLSPTPLALWPAMAQFENVIVGHNLNTFCWNWTAGRVKKGHGEGDQQGPWENKN